MAKTKTSSKGKKAQYAAYAAQNRALTNKLKRVSRFKKKNPNYELDVRTLTGHTRKKPKNSTLTKWRKRTIELMKSFTKNPPTIDQVLENLTMLKRETQKLRKIWNLIEYNATIEGN